MFKHFCFTLLLLLTLPFGVNAQNTVTGFVKDAKTQEPLIGVSVMQKGNATVGTVTDFDGAFSLQVPANATLVLSYVGYTSQEIALKGQKNITVLLDEDSKAIDEVVVVGYGSQKKVNLTGSVSQVKMDEIASNRPITSIAEALMGNVPGLTLSNNSGEPGSGYDFQIRGTSSINGGSPLVLVDGISMDISALNPNDIESVSVLKDASASAIYGARAAFGVILITTKKSAKEQKPRVNLSAKMAFSNPQSTPQYASALETVQGLMDTNATSFSGGQTFPEWIDLIKQYNANPSLFPNGYTELNGIRYNLVSNDPIADMLSTGLQQTYDVAVSGGTKSTKYRMSVGYFDQDGVLTGNKDKYTRYNVTSFVSSDVTKWLTTELTALYTHSSKKDPEAVAFNSRDIWGTALALPSFYPLDDTTTIGDTEYVLLTPRHMIENCVPTESDYNRLNLLGRIVVKPFEGLTLTGEYSINKTFFSQKRYNKRIANFADGRNNEPLPANEPYSTYRLQKSQTDYDALNLFATYKKKIQEHDFTVVAGMNLEKYSNESMASSRNTMINDEMPSLSLSTGVPTVSDGYTDNAIIGAFYRLNYSFMDRYLLEASGRYDGSSKFPENHRFGFFPSFSAGWRINQESFLKDVDWLSNLKLRASWGSIGNQNISEYQFLPTMTSGKAWWGVGEDRPLTLNTPDLVRANFTWEEVRTVNAGIDWGFLGERLTGSFDVFSRRTLNMLGPGADYPSVLGAPSPLQNAADMKSTGWELSLNWRDKIGDVRYGIGFNLSDAKAKITKYNNPTKSLSMAYYEGMELGEIWGFESDRLYTVDDFVEGTLVTTADGQLSGGTLKDGIPHYEGVNPNPGDMLYKNADENGLIWKADNTVDNPGSRRIIGNSTPRYTFGISGNVQWKEFGLSFLLQGVGKRDIWMRNGMTAPFGSGGYEYALYSHLLDYWTVDNQDAYFTRLYERNANANAGANSQVQSRYLFDGSYLDLKSVVLTYTMPANIVKKMGIGSCQFYLSGENLLSFNHMPDGIHPDGKIRGAASGVTVGGMTYPMMRKITVGVNVAF